MQIKSEVILRFKKEVAMRCMTSKILLKLDKLLKVYVQYIVISHKIEPVKIWHMAC